MAEIISHKNNGSGRKRLSTRVDLTPMVDLGFLLITFFIFTTTMSDPHVMKLHLPSDTAKDSSKTPQSKTISFVLSDNNKVWYYYGNDRSAAASTDYSAKGIREVINTKRKDLFNKFSDASGMTVLIKPTEGSSYKNLTDALDEMTIGDVTTFMLVEPDEEEKLLVRK